ncbi:hypothetical protein EWB00_000715 [Schistosoma japonicum]|uniref:Uncharacterized protein n=1 Tax=Schistosoma japonicum TaxID=6182 RepID=A0A4Z2DI76_SCHJA|nr:hypothetical protein EWB00_000715 [Schistosoma japonicum]
MFVLSYIYESPSRNNSPIDWDVSYGDKTTANYAGLSTKYCNLIMKHLQMAPLTANKQKACTNVILSPRQILLIWEKRQSGTNTTSNIVGGNATIQINSTTTDILTSEQFSSAFITSYNTSNTSNDSILLYDIQAGSK